MSAHHTTETPELAFSRKYDYACAENYFHKRQSGMARRLSHWRETQIARHALQRAGNPASVPDLPCGAGRFWPMLLEQPKRVRLAADNSTDMLQVARSRQSPEITRRVTTLQTSAFAIDLPNQAVDCVFCMRLLHHIGDVAHRIAMLREFHRVTRESVVVSLWIDGNYKSWKRQRLERRRLEAERASQNRFISVRSTIEAEIRQAGFGLNGHDDFLPAYAMWRVYTLRKGA
ncbi:MAG: class I SAM-dependent methyltransferase [Zoogloeaceae bacterium]|nr:class I SAM-dependent methyltransferase [Zoogloeaceae bacterium]